MPGLEIGSSLSLAKISDLMGKNNFEVAKWKKKIKWQMEHCGQNLFV